MGRSPTDFLPGAGNVIKNLTTEVFRECSKRNVNVHPEVVSLVVSLMCLGSIESLSIGPKFDRAIVEELIKTVVQKFLIPISPEIKTCHMQALFLAGTLEIEKIEKLYDEKIETKSAQLLKEIVEFEANSIEEQDKLFKKIVIDIIVSNKLGKPSSELVVAETHNALKSVLSRADLVDFIQLKKKRRYETLLNLRQLVCGIRIFNKDVGHCGEGVRDIIADVNTAFKNTKTYLHEFLSTTRQNIYMLQNAIKTVITFDDKCNAMFNYPDSVTEDDLEFLIDILILYSQHEQYLKELVSFMSKLKIDIDTNFEMFNRTLKTLHEIVGFRIAVATEIVFPHFISLALVWKSLLTDLYVLVELNHLNDRMSKCVNLKRSHEDIVSDILEYAHDDEEIKECDILEETITFKNTQCKLRVLDSSEDIVVTPITNYCIYTLIAGNGALVPARHQLGVLQYGNNFYGISDRKFAEHFAANAENYFNMMIRILKKKPQLIVFFDLYEEIVRFGAFEETSVQEDQIQKVDVDIQTELHPIPYKKDKNYTWNIWDLRRRAINLANIMSCSTHACQTDISYFRHSSGLQAVEEKDRNEQTPQDVSIMTLNLKELKKMVEYTDCGIGTAEEIPADSELNINKRTISKIAPK